MRHTSSRFEALEAVFGIAHHRFRDGPEKENLQEFD